MSSNKIADLVSKFSKKYGQATVQYSSDPLVKAVNTAVGKKVESLIVAMPSITEAQLNIAFTPGKPPTAVFTVYSDGTADDKQKLLNELNRTVAPVVAGVMSKYQKEPLADWKWTTFRK